MIEIGRSLREARTRRGLSLEDVARETRIRPRYLSALEEEDFHLLHGDAYAKGFLRGYAEFLGLDGGPLVDAYSDRFADPEPPALPPPVRRRPWARRPAAALVLVAVLAAVIVPLAFRTGGHRAEPLVPAPAAAPRVPHPAARPVVRAKPRPSLPRVELVAAHGDCWVSVHAGAETGPLLFEGMLRQGERRAFAHRFLWVRLGAPWVLDATVNGKPLPVPRSSSPVNVLVSPHGLSLAQ